MPPNGKLEVGDSIQGVVQKRTALDVITLCEAGRYREAGECLKGLSPGDEPLVFGMVETARGNQEAAKDFLTRAPDHPKKGPQLALAYWRGGEEKEARDILKSLPESFDKLLCESIFAFTPDKALGFLERASRYDVVPGLQARLHNERARRLREQNYLDRAIPEFDAAIYYFELAESDCLPLVLINFSRVYSQYGVFDQAHTTIDRAIKMLADDPSHLGKALDQKALIYLDEERPHDAEDYALRAIEAIETTDKRAWLAEFLTTHAKALVALGDYPHALMDLDRAESIGLYLNNDQVLINAFTEKKHIGKALSAIADIGRIDAALRSSTGLRDAAKKLQMESHQQLMRLMKKHGMPHRKKLSSS